MSVRGASAKRTLKRCGAVPTQRAPSVRGTLSLELRHPCGALGGALQADARRFVGQRLAALLRAQKQRVRLRGTSLGSGARVLARGQRAADALEAARVGKEASRSA